MIQRSIKVVSVFGALVFMGLAAYGLTISDTAYVWLPRGLQMQGQILPEQVVQVEISERAWHGWTFANVSGQQHHIKLTALTNTTDDLVLYVYGPDRRLYDMQANRRHLQLDVQLPLDGIYTIVVRGDAEVGNYQLTLQ